MIEFLIGRLRGVTTRTFTHDAAGNMIKDVRGATTYDYVINNAGRISQVKINTVVSADYEFNAQNQLVFRSTTVAGGPSGDMHYVYDRQGHLIAEADAATGTTVREYVWLADMPIAVVADVDTASPILYYVHVDHLNRPVMMTDGLKANVWEAVWLPFGAIHSITGTASNDARFPGQWFQIETGLHYNWHRHYDPTLARYTQADPLGFVDGPSVYAYALNSPQGNIDFDGRTVLSVSLPSSKVTGQCQRQLSTVPPFMSLASAEGGKNKDACKSLKKRAQAALAKGKVRAAGVLFGAMMLCQAFVGGEPTQGKRPKTPGRRDPSQIEETIDNIPKPKIPTKPKP